MSTITKTFSVNFLPSRSGLSTVGYTLQGFSRVSTGIVEAIAGSGIYQANITYDVTFQGSLVWDSGQTPNVYASTTINPSYVGFTDGPTSNTIVTATSSLGSLGFAPYAADEHIAIRASGDFRTLIPKWQILASASDGFFAAGTPWLLQSSTTDFVAAGVQPGSVISLEGPRSIWGGSGSIFAVSSVNNGAVLLRNIGLNAGVGLAPGPTAGVTGVTFSVPTLGPQIDIACLDLNRDFGIDPNKVDRSPDQIYDPCKDLTQAVVLKVLKIQYTGENRDSKGDFKEKATMYGSLLDSLLPRISARWGPTGDSKTATSIGFAQIRR